jgi:hypothetical protein
VHAPAAWALLAGFTAAIMPLGDNLRLPPAAPFDVDVVGEAHDNYVDVLGSIDAGNAQGSDLGGVTAAASDHMQRMRAPVCPRGTGSTVNPLPCPGDPVPPLPACGDAATLPELWERPVPDAVAGP